jgi:hypothetical protein
MAYSSSYTRPTRGDSKPPTANPAIGQSRKVGRPHSDALLPFLLFSINPSAIRQGAGWNRNPHPADNHGGFIREQGRHACQRRSDRSRKEDGETVLPAGSVVSGSVKRAVRVGLGIPHETASLDLEFNRVALPGGDPVSLAARVAEVDNARERVTRDGRIHGVRATDSGSYRISGYVRDLLFRCELHARLAEVIVKAAVINLPEPEIYLPAGAELTLTLTEPLFLASSAEAAGAAAHENGR